jgi:cellulose synthase/poly-beta-1,6-N-acetylglucosamine synthase-like glycosyltransferase
VLAGIFISSAISALIANIWLVLPWANFKRAAMRVTALFGGAIVAAIGVAALIALRAAPQVVVVSAVVLGAADLLWLPLSRRWDTRGHVVWFTTTTFSMAYLGYVLVVTFQSGLGPLGLIGGLILWLIEASAFLLSFAYLWEIVDVLARRDWRRRIPEGVTEQPGTFPFVSLHVPAHNEPPEMVIETLRSLQGLDYPAYEIVMLDDNTDDPALWRPVQEFCEQNHIKFHHLQDWPGYKSGALNFALHACDPRTEAIGIVDADYIVDSDWLMKTAPMFAQDPNLAFVQSPQNYRDWEKSSYLRRLFYSYEYFFAASQLSRNEHDGAIFAGTMGLIRKQALEQVGGWDEWVITEDAELSLRLLRAGWSGRHVERAFGHGVMPLTWEALKGQRFRWCFGGVQILRQHWRSLLPWDKSPDNKMTVRQRWSYLTGGLQWFGDPIGLTLMAFLLGGAIVYASGHGLVFRRVSGALLIAPAVLLLISVLRAVVVLKRRTGAGARDALGAFSIWLALSWVTTQACVRGLFQKEGVFLRTPKTKGEPNLWDALKANRAETAFALVLFGGAVAALVRGHGHGIVADTLALLLLFNALALAGAPFNSRAAMLADLSPELRSRRATERLRDRITAIRPLPAVAAGGAFAGVAALATLLLLPATQSPNNAPTPGLLHQVRNGDVAPAPAPANASPSPSSSVPSQVTPSPGSSTSSSEPTSSTSSAPSSTEPSAQTSSVPSATPAPSPTVAPTPAPSASPAAAAPAPSAGG